MSDTVVVAGAGLAGLVAARHLADAGADVTVYERRDEVGGRVRSRERDGFVLDRGFQVLFTGYPAVERELDLDALSLREFSPGAVVCSAADGTRAALADPLRDPASAVESALNDRVTLSDKLRTLALRRDLSSKPRSWFFSGEDASIEAYLREWGFSRDFRRNFAAPFYGGITLDRSLSTSKHVFAATFRALSDGAIAVPAAGMGAVPRHLADRVRAAGGDVVLGEEVEAVDPRDGGVRVETTDRAVDADAAVVATDPPTARELTGVESVPTEGRPSVTQYYALDGGGLPSTGRKILLNADDDAPNLVVPLTDVAPEYAPEGRDLVCATFLGREALNRDAAALAADARDALAAWFPERTFDDLDRLKTDRVRFAQFDQPPGVHDRLPGVRDPDGRVYLAGEYTEWSSIQGAMESGRTAAQALLTDRGLERGRGRDGERAVGDD